jgi:hypothetical protein
MQPVNPDLQLLIRELEKEQRSLKKMIREASAEFDSIIVYYHSEALLNLNRRLDVLYSFRDPWYEKKKVLKRQISGWRKGNFIKKMRPEARGWMKKRCEEKALALEKQLQQLMDITSPPPLPGTHFIDAALLALYEKRCSSFRLILGEVDDGHIALVFKIKKNTLVIDLKGQVNGEEPDFIFEGRIPRPLLAAGFVYDPKPDSYTRTFDFAGYQATLDIKKWLAKFIIDDTMHYWSGGKMTLIYK